jgi:hypothetical protein
VLVLAGDIDVADGIPAALALLCRRFRDASVVYVHGNHEFYNTNRSSVLDLTRRAQAENPNLVWLDSSGTELLGFNFLGAPLWFPRSTVDEGLKHALTDFSVIEDFESWVYEENARAVAFLDQQLRPTASFPGHFDLVAHLPRSPYDGRERNTQENKCPTPTRTSPLRSKPSPSSSSPPWKQP